MSKVKILLSVISIMLSTAFASIVCTNLVDGYQMEKKFNREAVIKGHGVWVPDAQGDPVFSWLEIPKESLPSVIPVNTLIDSTAVTSETATAVNLKKSPLDLVTK